MQRINRRRLVTGAAFGTAASVLLPACTSNSSSGTSTNVSAQASNQPNIRWRMVTSWPQSLDTIYGGAVALCDRIAQMTDNHFRITPFAAGEIVPGLQVLDAVQAGTVECGHSASYYYVGKNPALAFGTAVPFGLTAQQQNAWYYHGGGLKTMHRLYADFNVIAFPAGNTGAQMGGWFKREVSTAADLQGLKMRIPGIGGEVMKRLGVLVQVLPGGEIFLALERGTIDAAEFVGPYDDEKLGLQNAAPFYYYPGWWEPSAALDLTINLDAWNSLPQTYREVVIAASYEANIDMLARYETLNGTALQQLAGGGTELRRYSTEILAAGEQAALGFLEEQASGDRTFQEIYTQWKAFKETIQGWNQLNELSP